MGDWYSIRSVPVVHRTLPVDVSTEDAVDGLVAEVTRRFGVVDVLVNNAGITEVGTFTDTPLERLQRVVQLNIAGVTTLTRL